MLEMGGRQQESQGQEILTYLGKFKGLMQSSEWGGGSSQSSSRNHQIECVRPEGA